MHRPGRVALQALIGAVCCVTAFSASARAQMPCADLSLVLAMDASGSMTDAEFDMQMSATATALQHPEVIAAIRSVGGIVLAAVIWSDSMSTIQRLDWELVTDAASAARHAARLMALDRGRGGNTDMGQGIAAALDMQAMPGNCAGRRIVNVSGDGRETPFARGRTAISVAAVRARAVAEGVTINGLAITDSDSRLRDWFERAVITGPGAFAMEVDTIADFGTAMRLKLIREIRGEPNLSALDAPTLQFAGVFPERPLMGAPPPG